MRFSHLRRRAFIPILGGLAVAWPLIARAQQSDRMRRLVALMPTAADDPLGRDRMAAFRESLQSLGWSDGRNLRIEVRWTSGRTDIIRKYAAEAGTFASDVMLIAGGAILAPVLEVTRAVPIVFVHVPDPVGAGFVESLARPGGNATGFLLFEYGTSAKWLELLKQMVAGLKVAAVLRDPAVASGLGQWGAIQAVAPSFGVELVPINLRDTQEMERAIAAFARSPNSGLIVTAGPLSLVHRNLIIRLAGRHKLPAVYFERQFVTAGGLMSYGPDLTDQYRRAAAYVDRILKGEKPADLPVQAPTKFELLINLKTAKALALAVPDSLLVAANEVIQ